MAIDQNDSSRVNLHLGMIRLTSVETPNPMIVETPNPKALASVSSVHSSVDVAGSAGDTGV
jgi:hypothetical protein